MREPSTGGNRARKLRAPRIITREKEAQWWHDHPEYWDDVDTPWELVEARGPGRSFWAEKFRLPLEMVTEIKAEAERRGIPWHDLVEEWIRAGLARARQEADAAG